MLDILRRGATSKLASIIVFLPLIAAFALWGIGPEWRNGGRPWLAKVGSNEIFPEDFDRAFRNEIEQISRQAGRPITPDQARQFGLDRRVLSRLIGTSALDQQVQKLGLTLPAQAVADEVRADPAFADVTGRFAKQRFDDILHQVGLSEAGYLATRRRDDVREQLTDSLLTGVVPATAYVDLMNKYRGETRVLRFVDIDPAKAVKIADPDDTKLKVFYDAHTSQFALPESRKIGVLLLTRDAVKGKIEVSEDEIKKAYEANKERYNVPETRHVLQMSFADKTAAEAAQPALAKAKDFVEAAVKLGAKATDVDLGTLSKSKMIDEKIATAAFALKKDEVSKAIAGTFTNVVLKVTEITAGKEKTLADVNTQVRDMLQSQRAAQEIQLLGQQVEDERSAGKPLSEAANKLNLVYKEIAQIDASGKGADGKPVLDNPDLPSIAAAAFGGAIGLDPDPVDLNDGGVAWVTVLGVTPAKDRPFEDVKADVQAAWAADEMQNGIREIASKLVDKLAQGASFDAIAKEAGGKPGITGAINRTTSPPGLTQAAVAQSFSLPLGGAASAPTADGKTRTLFKVDTINAAESPSKAQFERLKQELTQSMQSDILGTYVEGLQKTLGVNVDNAAIAQVLGGGQPIR